MAIKLVDASVPARLFLGTFGQPGHGKSFSASAIATRWAQRKGGGTIAVFDTERAWGWLKGKVAAAGCKLLVADAHKKEDRSPTELRNFLRQAIQAKATAIAIDSLTHILEYSEQKYMADHGIKELQGQQYSAARKDFVDIMDAMLNSDVDIIICGRHGNEHGQVVGPDGQKREGVIGHKMKAGNAGYDFDMLLEADKTDLAIEGWLKPSSPKGKAKKVVVGTKTHYTLKIRKDRSDIMRRYQLQWESGDDPQASWEAVGKTFDPFFDFLLGDHDAQVRMPERAAEDGEGEGE